MRYKIHNIFIYKMFYRVYKNVVLKKNVHGERKVSIKARYSVNPTRMRARRTALTKNVRREGGFEDFSPTKREEHLVTGGKVN